jgi:hypothetical protein
LFSGLGNNFGDLRRDGVDERRLTGDFDGLGAGADLQVRVNGGEGADLNDCVDGAVGLETRTGDGDVVRAGLQVHGAEEARAVGGDSDLGIVAVVMDDNPGIADDGSGGVGHGAADGAVDSALGIGAGQSGEGEREGGSGSRTGIAGGHGHGAP